VGAVSIGGKCSGIAQTGNYSSLREPRRGEVGGIGSCGLGRRLLCQVWGLAEKKWLFGRSGVGCEKRTTL
jgi:hypothetical protein